MLDILQIPVLNDNYIYLVHDAESGETAAVDPAEAEPVLEVLDRQGWRLTAILNTHHHGDHVGGNIRLKQLTGCRIVGAAGDSARIPGMDQGVAEGDRLRLGKAEARVLEVPGHTLGHIAFWFADDRALFCGDTLFALGCGRLFEGTAEQMWSSLEKIRALPADTRIYCAHEYTQANGRFALTIEPDNQALQARMRDVDKARAEGRPTVPSLLGEELATNPFLRVAQDSLRLGLGVMGAENAEVFRIVREAKDGFRVQ